MNTIELDIHQNLEKINNVVKQLNGDFDILFLPEMFNVGYVVDTHLLHENHQNITFTYLREVCQKYEISIMGSIPYFLNGLWYNSMFLFNSSGAKHIYDKNYLFGLGGEKENYIPGTQLKSFILKQWSIQPLICYDLRFPHAVICEPHPHLLVYSAQWPQTRITHWKTLLNARAIEHQCYVLGVNRFGKDTNGLSFCGESCIYNYAGEIMGKCEEGESYLKVTLSDEELLEYRKKLPFLEDWNQG